MCLTDLIFYKLIYIDEINFPSLLKMKIPKYLTIIKIPI